MKRFTAAFCVLVIFASVLTAVPGAYASSASGLDTASSEGDGLFTAIPCVPKYGGELSSQSRVILMDLETGNILIEQNGDVRAYPASTTKIMTAVLLIENTADDEWDKRIPPLTETNSSQSAKGSQLGLIKGDQPTRRDLLYGLLLPSGCDCAYVTSCLIGGSEDDFVFMMNTRASEIGMSNTGYENSYGLASNGHYTTAEDMAILIRHAMQYPLFRSTVSTAYHTLYIYNNGSTRTLSIRNTNHLLRRDSPDYYSYAIGVKTGTGTLADHCLTAAARKEGLELISIILNSDDNTERYGYTKELLEWGFDYYSGEGGLYSMSVTNAFFKANAGGCAVYSVPESSSEYCTEIDRIAEGSGIRVGAFRHDSAGKLWYMIWHGGRFRWALSEEMTFISYVNDIAIESGSALNGVLPGGEDRTVDSTVSSRHNVKVVTVTVYDKEGQPVTGGSNYPSASCTHTLSGTTVDQDVDLGILPAGEYTCVTHVEAIAYVPDAPDREYMTVEERSTIIVTDGTSGGERAVAYSYNANTGKGAPDGGVAESGSQLIVSDVIPTRPGCAFKCWNTMHDGGGESYQPGDIITPEDSFVLYAIWQAGRDEWVTDADFCITDGVVDLSGSIENEAGITCAELKLYKNGADDELIFDNSIDLPSNTIGLAELGAVASDLTLEPGSYTLVITASAGAGNASEVFRKTVEYKEKHVVVLYFDANGGSVSAAESVIVCGESFGSLPTPERPGFDFEGWTLESGEKVSAGSVIPEVEGESLTLKASWKEAGSGGSGDNHGGKNSSFLRRIPLWGWFAAGAAVVAGLIALMVAIIKKSPKEE